jgi:hypothetical protein
VFARNTIGAEFSSDRDFGKAEISEEQFSGGLIGEHAIVPS